MPGPHSVLGVSLDASEQQNRKAYREKAMLLHPDKNGGSVEAKENFIALHKAFERLTAQDKDPSEPVQSATARAASPPPGARKYGSAPPTGRRRSRSTSPPRAKPPSKGESVFEERRPRDASPLGGDKSHRQERRDCFRTSRPRNERESEPRRRPRSKEGVHRRPQSPPIRRAHLHFTRSESRIGHRVQAEQEAIVELQPPSLLVLRIVCLGSSSLEMSHRSL